MGAVHHQLGLPVLYSFRRCPYAMRARLAILAAGLEVEIRELVLRAKPEHMLALSPKGTVPVLWLPNGQVIDESLDVMHWAIAQQYPVNWCVPDADQLAQVKAWLVLLDGEFKANLDRYKYPNRYNNCDPLPHRQACVDVMAHWEKALAFTGGDYLFGPKPSVADCAILPFVRQFRIADEAWFDSSLGLPCVQAWLQRFLQSTWLEEAMHKYPLWAPGEQAQRFPAAITATG